MKKNYKRALAVIPARGGSKRVLRKNLRTLYDRPLVCHTMDVAVESGCFETIILSSDDDEILALAGNYPAITPLKREDEHAGDHATVFRFLQHFTLNSAYAGQYDAIALLLPTAPFRSVQTVQEVASSLTDEVDSVLTVSPYDFPVQFALTIPGEEGVIEPLFNPSALIEGNTRSQNQSPVYHPNGAMFFAWWDKYSKTGSFYKGTSRGVIMSAQDSIDIDCEDDFLYAEFQMRRRKNK